MNPIFAYLITVLLTVGTRFLGLKFHYVEIFGVFAHFGLAVFYYMDIKGDYESQPFQRKYALSTLNFLFAIELFARASGESLVYLSFFPIGILLLLSPLSTQRFLVCATSLILLVATNPWVSLRDRLTYASTLFLFWGIGLYKRSREQGHLHTIQRRLRKYESEDLSIKRTSGEYEETFSVQDKNWHHQQAVMDDRNKLFNSLIELVYQTYEPFTCCLYLYDEASSQFHLKAAKQQKEEPLRPSSNEAEGVFGAAFTQKHASRLISSQIETNHFSYYQGTAPTQIVWMVPVSFNHKKKALLILDFKQQGSQTHELDPSIEKLTEHVQTLIIQSEASVAHFKLREEIALLYRATLKLKDVEHIQDVYKETLTSLHEMAPCVWALALSYSKEEKCYHVLAEKSSDKDRWLGQTIPALESKAILSWVLRHRKFLYFPKYNTRSAKHPLIHPQWPCQKSMQSLAIWPVNVENELEGVFIFGFDQADALPRNMQRLISVFIQQVSSTIVQRKMLFQLEQLATLDGLTGVYNHRAFQDLLTGELERSKRQQVPLSLLLLDIDWFKKFNDEYGHRAGDFVLKKVAHTISGLIRKIDIFARYGGEEFVLLLPSTSLENAKTMGQRIVSEIQKKTFDYEGIQLKVTVSVGVSSYPVHTINKDTLIEYADRALYQAKRNGRNQSVSYVEQLKKIDLFMSEKTLVDVSEEYLRRRGEEHRGSI